MNGPCLAEKASRRRGSGRVCCVCHRVYLGCEKSAEAEHFGQAHSDAAVVDHAELNPEQRGPRVGR